MVSVARRAAIRMHPLDRKLLRDLWRLAPQLLAIALLASIGVAMAVMSRSALKAVGSAQERFYGETRFADVFATAVRAPRSLLERLRGIDGVVAVDGRAVAAGLLDVSGLDRPASLRLVALPDDAAAALNGLVLRRGRLPAAGQRDEAVASPAFVEAARVGLGDRLAATVAGRRVAFTIVGVAQSAEFVYLPAGDSWLPDDAHTAVLWVARARVEDVAGLVGAFSQVSAKLAPGVAAEPVLQRIDRLLAPYGGLAAVTRDDQPSHHFVAAALKRMAKLGVILPPLFLVVAAGLVYLVVGRLVDTEREQIGLLKAFGYTDLEVAAPYVKLGAIVGLAGSVLGALAGELLAIVVTNLYEQYFRFPALPPRFASGAFLAAGSLAWAAATIGALFAVRRAVALRPAAAMQPLPPTHYRSGRLDRWLSRCRVDHPTRIALRRLARYPVKSSLTACGLASSLALLVGMLFVYDAIDVVVREAYFHAQRWQAQLSFVHPRAAAAIAEVLRLPGVVDAQPVRTVATFVQGAAGRRRVPLVGLDDDTRLARPSDDMHRPLFPLAGGVALSRALAAQVGVRPGDVVDIEVLEGRRPRAAWQVVALSDDLSGLFAYVERRRLNALLGDGDLSSGANLLVAADALPELYRAITRRPQVAGIALRDAIVRNWRTRVAGEMVVTISIDVLFGALIAFGVAYNMGRITLAERSRDLATLQVLGFTPGECAYVLCGELALLALAAAPLGVGLGVGVAHGIAAAFSRDELRLPVVVGPATVGLALSAYAASVAIAAWTVARRVPRMELVAVLKTRE